MLDYSRLHIHQIETVVRLIKSVVKWLPPFLWQICDQSSQRSTRKVFACLGESYSGPRVRDIHIQLNQNNYVCIVYWLGQCQYAIMHQNDLFLINHTLEELVFQHLALYLCETNFP